MTQHYDSAQTTLERRALENVRGLVEKLEADDRRGHSSAVRIAIALVAMVAIAGAALIFVISRDVRPLATVAQTLPPSTSAPSIESPPPRPAVRREFVGSGRGTRFESYVDAFSRKIERAANSNYPTALRGLSGKVQVTAVIRSDGSVERIDVNTSSGDSKLGAAASDFVKRAQPFDAFSKHHLIDVDVLHITRTFTFEKRQGQS